MATFYVTHHLYPDNPHLFIADLTKIVKLRGEPNTDFWRNSGSEHFWELVIYTSGLDSDGESLGPYWLDTIGTEQTVNEFINNEVERICGLIDWSIHPLLDDPLTEQADRYPPVIYWQYPTDGQTDVPIDSRISVRLRDLLPAKGIDLSSITMTLDGFSITPEISGNPYDCTVSYRPIVGE